MILAERAARVQAEAIAALAQGVAATAKVEAANAQADLSSRDALIACVIRAKPATDSDAIRPPVPTEVGHQFRCNPATHLGWA